MQGSVFGLTGELPRKELQATLKAHGATVRYACICRYTRYEVLLTVVVL